MQQPRLEPTAAGFDLTPPPRESLVALLRRWRRSLGRLDNTTYWLVHRGIPAVMPLVILFIVNGVVIGWRHAYDVMLAITSPGATRVPLLAWFLSVAGWLVGPSIAGAVAGHVVTSSINARRRRPINDIFDPSDRD